MWFYTTTKTFCLSTGIDRIITEFAFSGTYAPTIFCSDEYFEYVRTEGDRSKSPNPLESRANSFLMIGYYKNIQEIQQRETFVTFGDETGVCGGDSGTSAVMLYPRTGQVKDWMVICPFMFGRWLGSKSESDMESDLESDSPSDSSSDSPSESQSEPELGLRYLSEYRVLPLENLLGRHIDDIINETPEGYILHELSHSGIIFNLLDVDHNGNQKQDLVMLGWLDLTELAT